jgi:hypothetical protein
MTSEEQIRVLSQRVAAAPDNSEEFRLAMMQLRAALDANTVRAREKIAAMQKAFPHSENE